jgi:hypothetical protein
MALCGVPDNQGNVIISSEAEVYRTRSSERSGRYQANQKKKLSKFFLRAAVRMPAGTQARVESKSLKYHYQAIPSHISWDHLSAEAPCNRASEYKLHTDPTGALPPVFIPIFTAVS